MKKQRVLVVPAGTEVGLEIYRSLSGLKQYELVGANSIIDRSSLLYDKFIADVPFILEPEFVDRIKKIVAQYNIDFIMPAHDDATVVLSQYRDTLGATLVCSPDATVKLVRSKSATYRALTGHVCVPELYLPENVISFPVIIKPDVGQGSKGVRLIRDREQLVANFDSTSLICEYLPGDEYTVDCFNNHKSELLFVGPRIRKAMRNGIAISTEAVADGGEFRQFAAAISKVLDIRGAWFFQVRRRADGVLCLLEVAVRIAGSMALNRMRGVNFSELSILVQQNVDLRCAAQDFSIRMERSLDCAFCMDISFQSLYLDFDDCLLLANNKLNVDAVKLIVLCRNAKKRVVLISRHAGDLKQKLLDLRIHDLFDEIIHITDKTPKSKYIPEEKILFIDDSFAERYDVYINKKGYVFGVENIGYITID